MIRIVRDVFVRHAGSESVIARFRNGGSTIFRNAQPFLEVISYEWRDLDEMLGEIALKIGCGIKDVRGDAEMVWRELAAQRFVEVECDGSKDADEARDFKTASDTVAQAVSGDDESSVGDFYLRHNLPAELHLDLTDRCNERCVHCYIPRGGGVMLPTELAMKAVHEFRKAQGMTVLVTGGECMLHPDFALVLREAKRIGLNIIVMSNLTRCDDGAVALLKEIDPQFVNVSLYSMKPEEHDAITQFPGSWDKTMRAILDLQTAGVHVRLATPILNANQTAIDELQKFAAEHHMHDVIDCDIIGKTDHDCSNLEHALSLEEMSRVVRAHRDMLARSPLEPYRCVPGAKACDIGDGHLCLNAYGHYYPCDGFHGMVLGDVRRDELLDVWRGEEMNRLRAMKNRDFGKCATCENRPWCKVCMMRNFNETGNVFEPAAFRCKMAMMYRQIWEGR